MKDKRVELKQEARVIFQVAFGPSSSLQRFNSEGVYLGRENKIALRETVNLVRPDGDFCAAPAEADVRVMALIFGQLAHAINEVQRCTKIPERVRFEQVMFAHYVPPAQVF
jgi:hypothetical protein